MRVNAAWARLCVFGASVFATSLAIGLSLAAPSGAADNYPNRKVRVIVPFAAGGPTDVIARMVSERLSEAWGQQLYVENMPGAGGNLGVETGGRAAPDGYTIIAVSTGFIINPSMYSKIGYDPVKDFAPISLVAASPNVVTVHPSVSAKIGNITDGSLRGIAILAKARVAALPELPTNVEEGVPGLESDTLTGIVAPAGTPKAIVDKWNAEIIKMVADPATKKKLDTLGFVPVANSPSEFAERIKSEMARWDKVVKTAGIQVD